MESLHRSWFDRSAMADLLDDEFRLAAKDTLYRCHDRMLENREALFTHLKERWSGLFGARYDVLLYDLTITYFEVDANGPVTEASKIRAFGYSSAKESAMRRKKLKAYWNRLKELQKREKLNRDELLLAIGGAKEKAGRNAQRLVILHLPRFR